MLLLTSSKMIKKTTNHQDIKLLLTNTNHQLIKQLNSTKLLHLTLTCYTLPCLGSLSSTFFSLLPLKLDLNSHTHTCIPIGSHIHILNLSPLPTIIIIFTINLQYISPYI